MARVTVYGNAAFCLSGYGTQALQLILQLKAHGHDASSAAFHGLHGPPINWDGIQIYPGSGEDPWAQDLLPAHYKHFGSDLLITLMDAWVLDPAQLAGMNVAHWLPVDCTPLSRMDRQKLEAGGGRPIAMSRFGLRQLHDAGFPALYAPHALDMSVWKPLPDREEARRALGFAGLFIVGINAANQDPYRKGFSEQLDAFAAFAAGKDDVRMLIHSRGETRNGVDLNALLGDLGLQGKAGLGDQYLIASSMVDEGRMVTWHGAVDLLSNCSWGEGFGLPVLQSQACGTPVVVTDCSAMTELCGAGWLVDGQRSRNKGHSAWWTIPLVPKIQQRYQEAYELWHDDPAGYQALRDKAVSFAQDYDAGKVYAEYWAPIIDELVVLEGRVVTGAEQVPSAEPMVLEGVPVA